MFGSNKASVTKAEILKALSKVKEPELGRDLVSLGMIKDIVIDDSKVSFNLILTTPACPLKAQIQRDAEEAVRALPGVKQVEVKLSANVPKFSDLGEKRGIPGVSNIIAVASGKGGVGKSTISVNLAVALAQEGAKVGLMDADIYGPSIPTMMGAFEQPGAEDDKIVPILRYGVKLISIGLIVPQDTAVIWRGPMVGKAVEQLLREVRWGELDYLIIDLPPGTGDAQLTLSQTVPLSGAIVVTTPQDVAFEVAAKGITMFRKMNVPILGIIENMSYFLCPHCGGRTDIFSYGGGLKTAERLEVPFLGEVPLDPQIRIGSDEGTPIMISKPESPQAETFRNIAKLLAAQVSIVDVLTR